MKQIKLGLSMFRMGYHVAAWRHPGVRPGGGTDFEVFANIAQEAERGKFDLLFMADELAIRTGDNPPGARARTSGLADFEPITLLSALATVTKNIGLVSTGSTTYSEPYNLARQFLSLDHLSRGRAGWNVVTSWGPQDAQNFGHMPLPGYELRYERASEFVDVVRGLWQSWDADAFLHDQDSGQFYDPAGLHELNHRGKYFSVKGPLNVPRSPQDEPVIVFAGDSEAGRDIAARAADVVFTAKQDLDEARAFYASLKGRLAANGRGEDDLLVMPGLMPIVAPTRAEAEAKYDRLQALIHPLVGLASLYDRMGDLSGHDIDGPVPEPADPAFRSRAEVMFNHARRNDLTIRQLYLEMAAGRGHRMVIGTPADIADAMEEWVTGRGADGFNIIPTHLPAAITDFVDLVVPELQRRGIFRHDYEGRTLRANLGVPGRRPSPAISASGPAGGQFDAVRQENA